MALIIGGHIRSGTTLLRNLCHAHPDISMTMEFGNFRGLDKSYTGYSRQLFQRCWRRRNQSFLVQGKEENRLRYVLQSYAFVARYLLAVRRHQNGKVDALTVEAALQSVFPKIQIVGDKTAYYVFLLDELVDIEGLVRVIIYRDCRDVTSSTLQRVRTQWRGRPFVKNWDTAAKIARRWVQAIELMERHADELHIIRYEDFVWEPEPVLQALGQVLGVEPAGFPKEMIRAANIGKYKSGLSDEELATVMAIAGPTMARLGYL